MSSTLNKNNFSTVHPKSRMQATFNVSSPDQERRLRPVESSPSLSMLNKLGRIRERHLSDPLKTIGLKPYQISKVGNCNCIVNSVCTVSSILRACKAKSENAHTGNHLPLVELMNI